MTNWLHPLSVEQKARLEKHLTIWSEKAKAAVKGWEESAKLQKRREELKQLEESYEWRKGED